MNAPDVIYVPNTTSPEHLINDDAFTAYVRLAKVKELIEGNQPPTGDSILAKSIDGFSFLLALEILQDQLEGLE